MRVLLTGATGFLGKWVLNLLVSDKRVSQITVITRQHRTHPSEKVQVIGCDLSAPGDLLRLNSDFDAVVHLAGQYNLHDAYPINYVNNLLATTNLLSFLRRNELNTPFHFASTYAVSAGHWHENPVEADLMTLANREQPYARTKGMAELAVAKAEIPRAIYRLGILVGDTEEGNIEKLDGPYLFLRLLGFLCERAAMRRWSHIPLPMNPESFLPLVPVDKAAKAIVAGVVGDTNLELSKDSAKYYGVYNSESILTYDLIESCFEFLKIEARPRWFNAMPRTVLENTLRISKLPHAALEYSLNTPRLINAQFKKDFKDFTIPDFKEYAGTFFSGFSAFQGFEHR